MYRREIESHAEKWQDMIEGSMPKYVVTLTHDREIAEVFSVNQTRKLVCRINNDYFGNNRGFNYISGFVVCEYQANGNPHYHITFSDNDIFKRTFYHKKSWARLDKNMFSNITDENKLNFCKVVCSKCLSLKIYGSELNKTIYIQDYYKSKLEEYLTKSAKRFDVLDDAEPEARRDNFDFIKPMTYYGF